MAIFLSILKDNFKMLQTYVEFEKENVSRVLYVSNLFV